MGWFDEQIRQRKENNDEAFKESLINIAGAVMGRKVTAALKNHARITKDAYDEIFKFYHIPSKEIPDKIDDPDEQLEYMMRPYGIMRRNVKLSKGWHKTAFGAFLGVIKESGVPVALIPYGMNGYSYFDVKTGKRVKITKQNEDLFEDEAVSFYKPFPLKPMKITDLVKYIFEILSPMDYVLLAASMLVVTVIGMLIPIANNIIFKNVIMSGSKRLLLTITVFLTCVTLSKILFTSVSELISARVNTKLDVTVEAATMMRVLSLPADFFKNYNSGELANRIGYVNELCNMLVDTMLSTSLTSIFSLIYISEIFVFSPGLVVPAFGIVVVTVVFSIVTAMIQMGVTRKQMELESAESGLTYALINGIQKIKIAGAEKRAFAKWGNHYAEVAEFTYNPITFLKINNVIQLAITLTGTLVLYFIAIETHVSMAEYIAFNSAYGMMSQAFLALSGVATTVASIKPIMEMIQPIVGTVPEIAENKQVVTRLSGGIELNNISFRYNENMPMVLDNLSLKIRPGQYVAIVGKTGCGKSTLMRLLLGFEKPQKGAIYYDGRDINTLDLKSLRRRIGVVLQDGKLFQGDIFSNITISAPSLSIDDAWKAAEMAGMADDIANMPMGMFTMVSEGGGGISGGQRQRLMIARAIAPNPKILMFDEATSALDNITQKIVSESLDSLKCTRIVIAHRLSTIKQCDRIIVLDNGKIIEDGKYDELIAKNGFFAELVERQRLDV